MEHILKLQPKYFDYINKGTKRIELRLYDEKRQKIAIGDTIIFLSNKKLVVLLVLLSDSNNEQLESKNSKR